MKRRQAAGAAANAPDEERSEEGSARWAGPRVRPARPVLRQVRSAAVQRISLRGSLPASGLATI